MKPQPTCACGAATRRRCAGCGTPICETHGRLGVDAQGQKQYLCFTCDERRHQYTVWKP